LLGKKEEQPAEVVRRKSDGRINTRRKNPNSTEVREQKKTLSLPEVNAHQQWECAQPLWEQAMQKIPYWGGAIERREIKK
jgi:hypothetical protein